MKEYSHTALYPNDEVSKKVGEYCNDHTTPIPQNLVEFHANAAANHPMSGYMISPFQASFQLFMAKAVGAKRILEIGCFIGFSAMAWSEAVGPDGHVTSLEFKEEYAEEARQALSKNKISNVEVIVGDAKESLKTISRDLKAPYDLIFIDADKISYPKYLELILEFSKPSSSIRMLRSGGTILADNVLRRALVADSSTANPYSKILAEQTWREGDLEALKVYNKMVLDEPRLDTFLLPLFDGINMSVLKD